MGLRRGGTVFLRGALLLLVGAGPTPPAGEVQELPPEQASAVLGQDVADTQGKVMGRLIDILVAADGKPEAAVIDFGGFMGVGARKIAVHWSALHFTPGDKKRPITLDLTPDQIKAAPEFKNPAKAAPVVVAPAAQPAPQPTPQPTPEPTGEAPTEAPAENPADRPEASPPPQ